MLVQIYVSKFLGFSRFTWGPVVFAYGHKGTHVAVYIHMGPLFQALNEGWMARSTTINHVPSKI